MNILYLYNSTQTYTNTVFEHISSFGEYSRHRSYYSHLDEFTEFNVDLSCIHAIAIHYSVRLPFDQISPSAAKALSAYPGLKFLFIQDEYDHVHRAWHWIKTLGLQLVFTVVPNAGVERIYPVREFSGTRFVSNLTGYVPGELRLNQCIKAPSQRRLIIGYRGRPLPVRYGQLGMEKIGVGKLFKDYCDARQIMNDIAWTEESRIYGPGWYEFMVSCRSMLGSESGSNVFDWDGALINRIAQFRKLNPKAGDDEIYERFVKTEEIHGIMNQVSPRIFEAIAAKTVLVLFEGGYSGVVKAGDHFIPVKKDGSNLAEVMRLLQDGAYVDAMAERAYQDVIVSGKYSYQSFVRLVDEEIEVSLKTLDQHKNEIVLNSADRLHTDTLTSVTASPIRAKPPQKLTLFQTIFGSHGFKDLPIRVAVYFWQKLPKSVRLFLKPKLKHLFGKG